MTDPRIYKRKTTCQHSRICIGGLSGIEGLVKFINGVFAPLHPCFKEKVPLYNTSCQSCHFSCHAAAALPCPALVEHIGPCRPPWIICETDLLQFHIYSILVKAYPQQRPTNVVFFPASHAMYNHRKTGFKLVVFHSFTKQSKLPLTYQLTYNLLAKH